MSGESTLACQCTERDTLRAVGDGTPEHSD